MNKQTQKEKAEDVLKRYFEDENVTSDFAAMAGALVYVHDMAEGLEKALRTNLELAGITDTRILDGNTRNLRMIREYAETVVDGMRKYGLPIATVVKADPDTRRTN